ncbi:hypothetical protein [Synechococcus sp. PCC 7336]|uniref:hypothetical protein n=1 Tax=Synechococcus sp. PCC 7336 TaxID=195250 RepID=UPI0005702636|nr:hypothetical protein [Synechococcus sp. PCC 7336]
MTRLTQKLTCLCALFAISTWTFSASAGATESDLLERLECTQPGLAECVAASSAPIVLPVVFHLSGSQRWQSPHSLVEVIAETQRILDQAKIEIQPIFAQSERETEHIDVYLVPFIRRWGRSLNGVSFRRGAREVFVRDDVALHKVDDRRPPAPLSLPRYWPGEVSHDRIAIDRDRVEQARTIAHEIGHQLGLVHVRDPNNLQASGTTGWILTDRQIQTMRQFARQRGSTIALSASSSVRTDASPHRF